jgi:4-hydroxy-3-methylbut-2-enyl diphosphate reductase
MGVRRAVETAWRESSAQGERVFTIGPLIHNPSVLADLEKRGVTILEQTSIGADIAGSTVIVRAHGIAPELENELVRHGAQVVDATCPHVKLNQKKAQSFAEHGYRIFLAGEKNHGEISGICGYIALAGTSGKAVNYHVVGNALEAHIAAQAAQNCSVREEKTALIAQTTISADEYSSIAEAIKKFFPNVEIADTICAATAQRQQALRKLCGKVEAVIVAGGKESANTLRLLSLAKELGKPAWLVEKLEEIPAEISMYETVGLCAGASTPDSLINEIEKALEATHDGRTAIGQRLKA